MTGIKTLVVDNLKEHKNLELAAGCGNFGKLFFPECILTDKDYSLKNNCINCSIDHFCDAHDLPWSENRFENVIICNPYGFGFSDVESAELLLKEVTRVLTPSGKIIVLGAKSNKYVGKIPVILDKISSLNPITFTHLREEIVHTTTYPNYIFRTTNGDLTTPTLRFTIHVTKP